MQWREESTRDKEFFVSLQLSLFMSSSQFKGSQTHKPLQWWSTPPVREHTLAMYTHCDKDNIFGKVGCSFTRLNITGSNRSYPVKTYTLIQKYTLLSPKHTLLSKRCLRFSMYIKGGWHCDSVKCEELLNWPWKLMYTWRKKQHTDGLCVLMLALC